MNNVRCAAMWIKKNKLKIVAFLVLLFVVSVVWMILNSEPEAYQFRYDPSCIERMEIVKKTGENGSPYDPVSVLKTVNEANYAEVLASIQSLPVWHYFNDPVQAIGMYQFRIYYNNGEIEIIGGLNNAYVSSDGKLSVGGIHFETDALETLIMDILTEKSEKG